jgi:hypothetical protein
VSNLSSEDGNILAHHILAPFFALREKGQEYDGQEYFVDRTLHWYFG